MHRHRLERVLVVNDRFELRGLITVKDILKSTEHPNACKDELGQLRVGAAVGTAGDTDERVEALVAAGVDVIVVDTSHGHSQGVLDRVRWSQAALSERAGHRRQRRHRRRARRRWSTTVRTRSRSASAPARSARRGSSPASACRRSRRSSTRSTASPRSAFPLIADGGIRYSGDIAKAIAAGASLRRCWAASLPAPKNRPARPSSIRAARTRAIAAWARWARCSRARADRYFQDSEGEGDAEKLVPEGIEGRVPYKGPIVAVIHQLMGGVRAAMGYCGCATIDALRTRAEFVEITSAGIRESHVHDVQITKEAPNYRVE